VAHCFIGGLVAAAYVQFDAIETETDSAHYSPLIRENVILVVALSLVEVGCALWFKFVAN
jgi:hypothetical protein